MPLIDRTVPLPPAWPPPKTVAEYESIVNYLLRRDPIGYRIHLSLACLALLLAPLWQAPSAIAFGMLAGYALLRLPNTWRCCSALFVEPAMVAWLVFGLVLALSITWNPFDPERGLDHLAAWRVMLYPALLLPVLPARRLLLAAMLVGCLAQLALMIVVGNAMPGYRWIGPLHNVNMTGMWGAVVAATGTAALVWGHWWGLGVLGTGVATGLLSASRGSLIAITVGSTIVLGLGVLSSRGRERWRRLGRVVLPAVAAGVVALIVLPTSARRLDRSVTLASATVDTEGPTLSAVRVVDAARFQLWRLALLKAQERPVLGWGLGAYPSITTTTIETFDRSWWTDPASVTSLSSIGRHEGSHSMYMRVACEQGLLGLVALLAAVTLTIEALTLRLRDSAMALGGLGVMVAWMVYAGTEDAHTLTRALLPVPMILALVIVAAPFDARRRA
jgi:O-antigen ligase